MEWENPPKSNPPNLRDPARHGPWRHRVPPRREFHHLWSSWASPGLTSAAFPELLSDQDPDAITSNRLSWSHVTSWNSWAAPGSGCSRHGATSSLNSPLAAQSQNIPEFSPVRAIPVFPWVLPCCSHWDRLGFSLQLWGYPSPSPKPDSGLAGAPPVPIPGWN